MKAVAILALLVLFALAPSAVAGEVGQCAVAVFNFPNVSGLPHALILDAKNGYVLAWMVGGGSSLAVLYEGRAVAGGPSDQTVQLMATQQCGTPCIMMP